MRVRTALVHPSKASGVNSLFDLAVDRHLAWVIGVGHDYADLEKLARKHGYEFWTYDNDSSFWVAIRSDLIENTLTSGNNHHVTFESSRPGLGRVAIGSEEDLETEDKKALVFLVNDEEVGAVFDEDDRVKELNTSIVPVQHDGFRYTEILYSIKALTD